MLLRLTGAYIISAMMLGDCSTRNTGGVPGPGPGALNITQVTPADFDPGTGEGRAGDTGTFSVSWSGGTGPFTVTWNFDGGAQPDPSEESGVAASPNSVDATLVNAGSTEAAYQGTVTVADSAAGSDTEIFDFTVGPGFSAAPVVSITNYDTDNDTLSFTADDADSDNANLLFTFDVTDIVSFMDLDYDPDLASGTARAVLLQSDGEFTVTLTANDQEGGIGVSDPFEVTGATVPALADAIVLVPSASSIAVGGEVTVTAFCVATANGLRYMDMVRVIYPDHFSYKENSFNYGFADGAEGATDGNANSGPDRYEADGVWAGGDWPGSDPDNAEFLTLDNEPLFIKEVVRGDGRKQIDFNITPMNLASDIADATGELFNFKLIADSTGTGEQLRLEPADPGPPLLLTVYYTDGTASPRHQWTDTLSDHGFSTVAVE